MKGIDMENEDKVVAIDDIMHEVAVYLDCPLEEALAVVKRLREETGLSMGKVIDYILFDSYFDGDGTLRLCPSA
jgi:hypothetical protein